MFWNVFHVQKAPVIEITNAAQKISLIILSSWNPLHLYRNTTTATNVKDGQCFRLQVTFAATRRNDQGNILIVCEPFKTVNRDNWSSIVQSLNSLFFPPHTGAEPGWAKEESRITCVRMLRTNQSKITRSQPRRSRQCVAQYLFQLALWKKTFSLTLILSTSTRHYSFPKKFFRIVSVRWAILQKLLKGKSDAYK